ncbi:AF4/FMR2 family member 3-like [Patiria miniata]|uniref:AF4/FMR2 family member lilli n=1 Tax=Patiria miniata TaxID=46514 RepID=A0A913ZVM6_PATMI|nr:AF4/FMR2 family member 3-like [Patiria miniata]
MDTSRLSDSSSGSSSGESDDDSSSGNDTDSESDASSSDHESSPPQDKPAHKSYNLHDLINKKIIEGKKSPGALNVPKQPPLSNQPAAAASTAATPPTLSIKEAQSFPNTNQHRSTVPGGRRGEGSGGFVLGINDLTTTLTPPEDYDKGNFGKYVDNDNRINDFNKLVTEKRTPLSKSPVRTGGNAGKQNANKRGPKKVLDKSPSVAKSKTASQTKSEVSTKESKKGAKPSKQSSKSGAETKVDVKGKSSKTTPKSDKKTPPRVRTPEKKLAKKPTSKEFVSDTDSSSDSDDELERTPLSKRLNGASKLHAVLSPAHKPSARTEIKNKASSKGNRTKEKSNVVKTEREASLAKPVLDDVFMSMIDQPLGLIKEPLLSPIKNEDPEKPALTPHPQEVTYKDGIPSLVVKLNLSLINRVPGRPRQPCRTERTSPRHGCSASDAHYKNELLEFEERLPSLVKVHKRKQEDLDEEDPVKESVCKKPKSECSGKTSRNFHNEEPEHNELSSIPDSDTVLDRRRPAERRGSTNSVSSLLSSQSSCSSSRRSDREAPSSQPTKRRKKTANDSMDSSCSSSSSSSSSSSGGSTNYLNAPSNSAVLSAKGHITTWGSPPPQTEERVDRSQDSTSVSNDVTCTRNGHRSVSEEWGDVGGGADYVRNSNPHVARKNMTDRQPIGLEIEESQQFTADSYLAEGKKLKHQADAQSDKNVKALMYFDAALSFILCGNAMENDPVVPVEKAITMYSDTCDIIKFILKFKGSHLNQDALSMDKKLAVLCHRCLGLLYMKMFKMKKANGIKLAKVLGEHFRNSSKSQQAAQAPSSWNSSKHPDVRCKTPLLSQLISTHPSSSPLPCNRYTGTPSPMSPTPSPAGSVGSVGSMGSQGSNNGDAGASLQPSSLPQVQPNKLTNGVPHIMSSPANVSVPQRIVNMMSTFIQNSSYGYYGLDYWEQADVLALENIEFFRELDCEFGLLTLHSSTLDLVHYARLGLRKLKSET